jgi:putative ABC transport system substrate-binding protein
MRRRELIALISGAAGLWPFAARAQQKAMPVVGYLHFGSPGPFGYQLVPFRQGLAQNAYVEGQNVAIEYRWAEGHNDRLRALAADLVGRKVGGWRVMSKSGTVRADPATEVNSRAALLGISMCRSGLRRAGDKIAPCNSSPP